MGVLLLWGLLFFVERIQLILRGGLEYYGPEAIFFRRWIFLDYQLFVRSQFVGSLYDSVLWIGMKFSTEISLLTISTSLW